MAVYSYQTGLNAAGNSQVDLPTNVASLLWSVTLDANEVPLGPPVVSGGGYIWFLARLYPYDTISFLTTVYLYCLNTDGTILSKKVVPGQDAILQGNVQVDGLLTVTDDDICMTPLYVDLLGWRVQSPVSGVNLTVDGAVNTRVTPDGYTPTSDDVGAYVVVSAGTGWTPGRYQIVGVTGGAWDLSVSPAGVGTTGGVWSFTNLSLIWTYSVTVSDPSIRHISNASIDPSGDAVIVTRDDSSIRHVEFIDRTLGTQISTFSTLLKKSSADLTFPTLDASGIYLSLDAGTSGNAFLVKFNYAGVEQWRYTIGSFNTDDADGVNPSVTATQLYFVGNNTTAPPDNGSTNQVFSLDPTTGALNWIRHDAADHLYSMFFPLAISSGGDVFSGVLSGSSNPLVAGPNEVLALVSLVDGSTTWTLTPSPQTNHKPVSPVVGNDGHVLWADGVVYRVNEADGTQTVAADIPTDVPGQNALFQAALVPSRLYACLWPDGIYTTFPNVSPGAIAAYSVASPPPTTVNLFADRLGLMPIDFSFTGPLVVGADVAFELYFCGLANNSPVASAVYGAPTYFVFDNPVANTDYHQTQTPVDLGGAAPETQLFLRLRRIGNDPLDTSDADCLWTALVIEYDGSETV